MSRADPTRIRSPAFGGGFGTGYEQFKIGIMLRKAREDAGLTQDEIAERLRKKIGRIPH
jgi:hypothetical protein